MRLDKAMILGTFLGSGAGAVGTYLVNFYKQHKTKKLENSKTALTDELNQNIGYLTCKIDELEVQKSEFQTWNLLKRFATRKQVKNIDEEIREFESQVRELEAEIAEIRACKSMEAFRYAEEKIRSEKTVMTEEETLPIAVGQ